REIAWCVRRNLIGRVALFHFGQWPKFADPWFDPNLTGEGAPGRVVHRERIVGAPHVTSNGEAERPPRRLSGASLGLRSSGTLSALPDHGSRTARAMVRGTGVAAERRHLSSLALPQPRDCTRPRRRAKGPAHRSRRGRMLPLTQRRNPTNSASVIAPR